MTGPGAAADEARLFRPIVVLAMVVVGVAAFGAVLVLSAFAPQLRDGSDGGGHALSRSAIGYAALARLLSESDLAVEVSRGPGEGGGDRSLLVLTPALTLDRKAAERLDGSTTRLVVLPKWFVTPDPVRRGWVRKVDALPEGPYAGLLGTFGKDLKIERRSKSEPVTLKGVSAPFLNRTFSLGSVDRLQTLSGPGVHPVIVDAHGRAVLAQVGELGRPPETYVLSDPDLINNQGIASGQRAVFASHVVAGVRRGPGPVAFDATLNGFGGGRSLLRLAFEPPFLAATLCALAAALLAGVQAAVRFGPARPAQRAVALGKRALADNAAGLIRMARREHAMGERYATLVRDQTARSVGAPRDLSGDQLDAFLDRLAARAGASGRVGELTAAARRARDPASLLRAAQDLHRWRSEMTLAR